MKTEAQIVTHIRECPVRGRYLEFEWVGPKRGVFALGIDTRRCLAATGQELPWPTKKVADTENCFVEYHARTDVGFGVTALYHGVRLALRRAFLGFYQRLIVTAAVWGCAKLEPGAVPSIRHLHWPAWVYKLFGQ